ncbi:MAG: putative DNA binding domain-containing protein [Caldilineaceae bacterium]|nr:putative DNA binding domain-containing protein [Caldilineaceae bacterium]
MNLADLQRRIAAGENLHTELKLWPINPNSLAETLTAFANTDGGQLLIGVSDNGQMQGVTDTDAVMHTVDNIAYNNCEPPLTIVQETVTTDTGNAVVVVNIPKGDQRPYRTNQGRFMIRTTSGKRPAARQELLRLFQAAESLYYDETTVQRATFADLAVPSIEQFFLEAQGYRWEQLGLPLERILVNWKLAQQSGETLHPTVAGTLFFAKDPQSFLPQAYVTALRIPGTTIDQDPRDRKQLTGPLRTILEDAMRFLNIHLPTSHRIQGMEPEVKLELPPEALREALVNACAHRDYTLQSPIRLFIFDDRIEIRSPGGLPNSVTLEALPLGIHVLRNPIIYNTFLRMGLVTDAGSGIPRIIARVRQFTGQTPTWKLEGNEFVIALPRPQQSQS